LSFLFFSFLNFVLGRVLSPVPVDHQLGYVYVFHVLALGRDCRLHCGEAANEFFARPLQGFLRVYVKEPGHLDGGEQQVSQLFLDVGVVRYGGLELAQLFGQLV